MEELKGKITNLKITKLIKQCVDTANYESIRSEPFKWNSDFYLNTFLNMYCTLIEVPRIKYIKINTPTYIEPIIIVQMKKTQEIIHYVNIPFLQVYINKHIHNSTDDIHGGGDKETTTVVFDISNYKSDKIERRKSKSGAPNKFSLKPKFTIDDTQGGSDDTEDDTLDEGFNMNNNNIMFNEKQFLNDVLLKLYILADHAAYHYWSNYYRNNSDYDHCNKYNFDNEHKLLINMFF